MTSDMRPRRSALYMPGSKPRALEKARSVAADVLVLDLEDSVLPEEKAAARDRVIEAVNAGGFGPREVVVRVNDAASPWAVDDLRAVAGCKADAVLLPKVGSAGAVQAARAVLTDGGAAEMPIWGMIETPEGVLAAPEIAAEPGFTCAVMGTNDLAAELRCLPGPDRAEFTYALQRVVMAARAAGIVALDGVYNAFKDLDGLVRECAHGRALGFDGKTLIHPSQLDAANSAFAPDDAAIDLAKRHLAAFEEAAATGQGIAVVDGRIVENLHLETARRLLAQKAAIDAFEEEIDG